MPEQGEIPIRNHAAIAVGYDDTISSFIIRNSYEARQSKVLLTH